MNNRPTIPQLARAHAERGSMSKRDRNAALRAAGYDPDGDDGAEYRREFARAVAERDSGGLAIYIWNDGRRIDVRVQDEDEPPPHPGATRLKTKLRTRAEADEFADGVRAMAEEIGVESISILKHL